MWPLPTSPGPSLSPPCFCTCHSFCLELSPAHTGNFRFSLPDLAPVAPLREAAPELPASAVSTRWASTAPAHTLTLTLLAQNGYHLCQPGLGLCTQRRAPCGAGLSGSLLSEQMECTNLSEHWFSHLQNGDTDNPYPAFLTGYPEHDLRLFLGRVLQVVSTPPPVIPSRASVLYILGPQVGSQPWVLSRVLNGTLPSQAMRRQPEKLTQAHLKPFHAL